MNELRPIELRIINFDPPDTPHARNERPSEVLANMSEEFVANYEYVLPDGTFAVSVQASWDFAFIRCAVPGYDQTFQNYELAGDGGRRIELDGGTTMHLVLLNANGIVLRGPLLVYANGHRLDCYLRADLGYVPQNAKRILSVHMNSVADETALREVREREVRGLGETLARMIEVHD